MRSRLDLVPGDNPDHIASAVSITRSYPWVYFLERSRVGVSVLVAREGINKPGESPGDNWFPLFNKERHANGVV